MRNLEDVWRKRSAHYTAELQKYMRFVFTGHMALVIVFLLGAGGYQYSHWLDANHGNEDVPVAIIAAVIVSVFVTFSRPVTLLKKPDEVYLLPLETKLDTYFKRALNFTYVTQLFMSFVIYIVMWPMMRQVGELSVRHIIIGLVAVIVLKYLNVHAEFIYRWLRNGQASWVLLDYAIRFILTTVIIWAVVMNMPFIATGALLVFLIHTVWIKNTIKGQPFPYEHFVALEENRMMGIYRFANYFTDVPQVHGSIKRRAYFDFLYKLVPKKHANTFEYYLFRSVIRTDDHFYLWLRLVVINALVAGFVDIAIAAAIMSAALGFAVAIQLKQAIGSTHEFTMSMLYPLQAKARQKAAVKIVRYFLIAQAVIVLLASIMHPYCWAYALIIIIVGEVTLRMTK